MAKKVGKGLIALSSAAIVSVYGIGYAVTQPAAVSMVAGTTPAAPASAAPSTGPSASRAPSAAPTTAAGLKDGAYPGTGWSRHGSVSVSVTVQGGRIVSAPITGVTTRYSQSVIAGLPAKVVSAQSSRVDLVSGATDSSDAYVSAVGQALSQAGAPAAPASTSASTGVQPGATGGVQPGAAGSLQSGGAGSVQPGGSGAPAGSQRRARRDGLTAVQQGGAAPDGSAANVQRGGSVEVTGPNGVIYRGGDRRTRGGYGYYGD
jgi:uncharacterized protein with FMN-binding domain